MERLRKARDSMIPLLEAGRADGLGCRGLLLKRLSWVAARIIRMYSN